MKKLILTLLTSALFAGLPTRAHAVYTMTLSQVGNNVTLVGTGSLNLGGFTSAGTATLSAAIHPSVGLLYGGPTTATSINYYFGSIISGGPASFGSDITTNASSGSGDPVGIIGTGRYLEVPAGYVSGAALNNTSTWNNATFASLGFTPGTYTYTLFSGDLLIVTGVPEPSTWVMLGMGIAGLGVVTLRRRRAV